MEIADRTIKLDICITSPPHTHINLNTASNFDLFWHPVDFGQRFSLAHVARGCVCNRGITSSDKPIEKAVMAGTDQTGVFPLKSATLLMFLHPSSNLAAQSHTQQLSRYVDTQGC